MTAQTLDGAGDLRTIKAELAERVAALRERGVVPGLGTVLVGDDPGARWYVGASTRTAPRSASTSIRRRPARHGHPGRGGGRDRRAQRRPRVHRLHRPAADRARRVRPALAGRPRQGRRRAAPGQPRQARARRGRAAALHPGRLHRAAAPSRRGDRRRRGRRRGSRHHRRPPARAAADPPLRERHRHAVPHRHPRPRRARPQRRHRRGGRRRARHHHRRHGQARRGRARRRRLARRRQGHRRRAPRRVGRGGLGLAQPGGRRADDPRDAAVQHRRDRRAGPCRSDMADPTASEPPPEPAEPPDRSAGLGGTAAEDPDEAAPLPLDDRGRVLPLVLGVVAVALVVVALGEWRSGDPADRRRR